MSDVPNDNHIAIILNHFQFNHIHKKEGEKHKPLEERLGTEADVDNLKLTLPDLKYEEIIVYNDLPKVSIMSLADNLMITHSDVLNTSASLLIVILSHGGVNAQIAAHDEYYNLNEFIRTFRPEIFEPMAGKPIIFFISSCRGHSFTTTEHTNLITDGGNNQLDSSSLDAKHEFNLYTGIAVIYGTKEMEVGFRDPNHGTHFVQEATATLDNFVRDKSLKSLEITMFFTIMNRNLIKRVMDGKDTKQISQMVNTLYKPFYFTKK